MAEPEYEDHENGYDPDDLPDVEVEPSSTGNDNTPSVKGLIIQPFPQGQQHNPIEKFMKGSNKPDEFIPLTYVTDQEISRHSRMLYFSNIANYANGRMQDVMLFTYNLKRARLGQTGKDVVAMVSGERQRAQRDWESRQNRIMSRSRNNSPLGNNTTDMTGANG